MALQLERLPPAAQRVVRVLAAAGRRVDHRLLERAAAAEADELSAALRAALDAGVIVATRDGRTYEFRHALLREAAYAGEHTSLWIAWMNGALESAERVVWEILAADAR